MPITGGCMVRRGRVSCVVCRVPCVVCTQPPAMVPAKGVNLFADITRGAPMLGFPLQKPDAFPTNTILVRANAV